MDDVYEKVVDFNTIKKEEPVRTSDNHENKENLIYTDQTIIIFIEVVILDNNKDKDVDHPSSNEDPKKKVLINVDENNVIYNVHKTVKKDGSVNVKPL